MYAGKSLIIFFAGAVFISGALLGLTGCGEDSFTSQGGTEGSLSLNSFTISVDGATPDGSVNIYSEATDPKFTVDIDVSNANRSHTITLYVSSSGLSDGAVPDTAVEFYNVDCGTLESLTCGNVAQFECAFNAVDNPVGGEYEVVSLGCGTMNAVDVKSVVAITEPNSVINGYILANVCSASTCKSAQKTAVFSVAKI